MSECKKLIKALTIFDKYDGCISAEHDVIYVSVEQEISMKDYESLKDLLWDEEVGDEHTWKTFV